LLDVFAKSLNRLYYSDTIHLFLHKRQSELQTIPLNNSYSFWNSRQQQNKV